MVKIPKEVEKHSHCIICGKVTPPGEDFCSKKCEEKFEEQQESAAKRRKIFTGSIIAFAIAVIIFSLLYG